VFDRGSLEEPAQVSNECADRKDRRYDNVIELTGSECPKGRQQCYRPAEGSKDTRVGASAKGGGLVWEHEEEKEDARWGSYEVMHSGRARASSAAPISRRRCVRFL
jgi:hypothetical protein